VKQLNHSEANPPSSTIQTLPTDLTDLTTPQQLASEFPRLFNETQLNWIVRRREHNGLSEAGAILKVNGRLYVIRPRFFLWMLNQPA